MERTARHAELGHAKREACVVRHLARLLSRPEGTPASVGWAEAKSWYDLLDNPAVSVQDLRDLRAAVVEEGLGEGTGPVLAIHDVSALDYTGQEAKADRRAIGDGRGLGYEYHACLALDPSSERFLGIVHDTVVNRDGPDDGEAMDYESDPLCAALPEEVRQTLPENHRHQLAVHIRGLKDAFAGRPVIEAGDREFDDVPAMAACQAVGHDFVFRALGNRTVEVPEAASSAPQAHEPTWRRVPMARLLPELARRPYKDVPLDKKGHVVAQGRPHRVAKLSIGGCRLRLFLPFKRGKHPNVKLPEPLEVNLVVIREVAPPAGVTPLCWILFTSLPVDTFERMAWVGHLYELRWRIEEYFKLLKSGFGLEQTRFDNAAKTAKALVFYSLAALGLLELKASLALPATGPLDEESYHKVKHAMAHPEDPRLEPNWALLAVVLTLGGWLGRRGDPVGPTVLMRGFVRLAATTQAVRQFPDLIERLAGLPAPQKQKTEKCL